MGVTEASLQHSLIEFLDGDNEALLSQDLEILDHAGAVGADTNAALPQPKSRFAVTDVGSASWALKKIALAQGEQAAIDAFADAEIARINLWRQNASAPLVRKVTYLTTLLLPYHAAILQVDPRAKTIKLPHGELQMRAQQPTWEYTDAALPWIKDNRPEWVRVKTVEELDKAAIKKTVTINGIRAIDPDGVPIPGITITERSPLFKVVATVPAGEAG